MLNPGRWFFEYVFFILPCPVIRIFLVSFAPVCALEAVNKIVKYRFLYNVSLPDFNSLKKYLEKAIPLYNNVMPHGALGGIPPVDVLHGKSIDKYNVKEKLENARKLRIIENRKANCGICE